MYLRNPNYMQIEENWVQKKTTTLHYFILKLCSILSISNHATVTKIKITFIRELMGIQLKVLNILSSPNHRCIILYIQSPKLMYVLPG